ncbi:MAG: UbiD family decarboxylase [Bacteroidota bacterium]
MSYSSMRAAAEDLERNGQLIRIKSEVDPDLEMAEIHRRIFDQGGPALLFERVKGSPFQAISNIYGTFERTEFLFRHTLERVKRVVELKADPSRLMQRPGRYLRAPFTALTALPRKRRWRVPVAYRQTTIDRLPLIKSWPMDGGAFVTMPQVCTLPPGSRKAMQSNIGMYRIQLSGNDYQLNQEIGLHYQLHRGIGVHHTQYNQSEAPFRASVFVGGPPSHAFSAIMPLPEGLSEMTFAGMLAGRRFGYAFRNNQLLSADADFVITGTIRKGEKMPEGPFGDHLGYYSLQHDFPVMDVEAVYHRKNPLWHFSVVGRPPQEDSSFGYLIHQIVEELTPQEFPGIRQINAVDEAGVHPLLLAIGSERYMPFREKVPEEILTQANRILGSGQTSLAKYLIIAADEDDPELNTHRMPAYFRHVLERIDPRRDLHFYTNTTIDTLDYSGSGWNAGSKVVLACRGEKRRDLVAELPKNWSGPKGFDRAAFVQAGILAMSGPAFEQERAYRDIDGLKKSMETQDWSGIPLVVICDDPDFVAQNFSNFLWVTFTRSNPSHDLHGVNSKVVNKHWGCAGPIIIDARIKPWHAPGLETDPEVSKQVDRLFQAGGELSKWG